MEAGPDQLQRVSSERQRREDVANVFIAAWVGELIVDDSGFTVYISLVKGVTKGRYENA